MRPARYLMLSATLALGAPPPVLRADPAADAAAAANNRALVMQRFMVSATRIAKNPWRYASLPGFEILSRASDSDTAWWVAGLERGIAIENQALPKEWLPDLPVPTTVIIDDTDLDTISAGSLRSQTIVFHSPTDAMTWGKLAGKANVWADRFESRDPDTYAINSDVFGVNTDNPSCVIGLERVSHCTPPLPLWLFAGLLGQDCGLFREGLIPVMDGHEDGWTRTAMGAGTLWVSLEETRRLVAELKKDGRARIEMLPLGELFGEAPPPEARRLLWESEAGLFARWGLMGPGRRDPGLARSFRELVRRARTDPVTEAVFTECFGFGYAAMEARLESFLRDVLAQPTAVDLNIAPGFPEADLKAATADQIGRILGDWLRMQAASLRARDPALAGEFLGAAGRMMERAYREDNGLPPGTDPARGGEHSASQAPAAGPAVLMKPFVVSATQLHDPGLLAVYGLYEHDSGDDAAALGFLEAAAQGRAARPRAYLALAGIRYAQATAKPLGAAGTLRAAQAASILEPLETAPGCPPDADFANLVVATWGHSEARASPADIARITAQAALFPRDILLTYRSAKACIRAGDTADGAALIERGLLFATDEHNRAYFVRLRSTLPAPVARAAP